MRTLPLTRLLKTIIPLTIILLALSIFPIADVSAAYSQISQLSPTDPAAANQMGYAVDMAGTLAVVGVPGDSDHGADTGSAYLWRRNADATTWTKVAKLTAPDATAADRYGSVVAAQ